jgi:hypothetical protein
MSERVVCFSPIAARRRHLMRVAAVGGWPLVSSMPFDAGDVVAVVSCYWSEAEAIKAGAVGTVMMEHGVGQVYAGARPLTPWGAGRGFHEKRRALLAPGPWCARVHAAVSPVPVVAVGSPFLDGWFGRKWGREGREPVVAFSTHWDCGTLPETRSSWGWIKGALPGLARRFQVLGHWHPHEAKAGTLGERLAFYEGAGIEPVADFEEVMERADVFICDNSSALYEFAALGKPVVVLSPPFYRREVRHGLRFWDAMPGVEVVDARALCETVAGVLQDDAAGAAAREWAMPVAWGNLDGCAGRRAVEVVREFVKL